MHGLAQEGMIELLKLSFTLSDFFVTFVVTIDELNNTIITFLFMLSRKCA